VSVFKDRQRGYETAMRDHGLTVNKDHLLLVRGFREDGAKAAEKLMSLENPPDAIFSNSDFSALGAMQWLLKNGYQVPQDISVAGFGNDQFTDFLTPTMTSIDQKSFQMGKAAAQLFLDEMMKKTIDSRKILLSPEIIIRDSTSVSVPVN
jgi:LacI family transcriptional regulator